MLCPARKRDGSRGERARKRDADSGGERMKRGVSVCFRGSRRERVGEFGKGEREAERRGRV